MKKRWGKWVILLVVLVVAAAVVVPKMMQSDSTQAVSVSSYTVGRGDVAVTITGSGMLEVKDTLDVMLPEGVEVEEVLVEQGDMVQAGDMLLTLDQDSLTYRAAELSAQLATLDQQLSLRRETDTIQAPIKGRIKYLPADEDDEVIDVVNQHGALAILSTDGLMEIIIETEAALDINAEVKVKWNGGSEKGTVVSRTQKGYRITLSDEDAPYQATATVYDGTERLGMGTLEIHAPMAIFGNGGTIETIHYSTDDAVALNAKLFTLSNAPVANDYRKTMADRQDVAEQLQTVLKYQSQPYLLAEADGTVNEVLVADGKKIVCQDGSGEVRAMVLGIGGPVKMIVDVDELDVNNVAVGQTAKVTMDAFSSETFIATVQRISYIGKAAGSITNYAVELELQGDERLRAGMNGSAVIQSNQVEDVVIVPLGAVHEDSNGSYVYLLDDEDQQTKRSITTGLSDGSYAEVTDGLTDGDRIVYGEHKNTFVTPLGVTVDADMMTHSPMGGMLGD